ncbi:LADA_0A09142g1_1 [Lachancea dasiensis]|uniref:LADA_0A09142g1_1 n=1 Tax=Lachancea dasiensis TaxID=1072105 RepID=A0A1G4IR60_9SACH|nr:LADA_0A09142g1_1 [Lachancea dasiensis]
MDRGGIPAIVFLVLYFVLFSWVTFLLLTKRVLWRSRYTSIFVHTLLRLAAQICGIGYGVAGVEHINWLIAYLVFGAEGYFTLVWCAYRFLIAFQNEILGNSWIEPKKDCGFWSYYRVLRAYPVLYIYYLLAAANGLIIAGSVKGTNSSLSDSSREHELRVGRALRDAGTAIFMALVVLFAAFTQKSYMARRGAYTRAQSHFLLILGLTAVPLLIRGVYGILGTELRSWNYALPEAYDGGGLRAGALAAEYVLGTSMEWVTCLTLLSTSFISITSGANEPLDFDDKARMNSKGELDQELDEEAK